MIPLKVSITLASQMAVPEHPIHLDGVLSALRVRQAEEEGLVEPWLMQHDLPLDRYESPSGQWVFKASILRPRLRQTAPFLSLMTSRINFMSVAEDIQSGLLKSRQAAPNLAGGPFKTPILSLPCQWYDQMVGFAVGDREEIERLLTGLEFLGSRRSQALGRVKSVLVEEVAEADCTWSVRALPIDSDCQVEGTAMAMSMGNLRAPYWKKTASQRVLHPVDF